MTDEVWTRLTQSRRRKHCKTLAQIAAGILAGKDLMHALVGSVAGFIADLLGANRLERTFVEQLASKIPLPPDAKLVAVARGVQLTGIVLCLMEDEDLTRCQCFIDLALTETRTRVKKLLEAALNDWTGLDRFPSSLATSASN